MNRYAIYCTEEQTRKALELGAPIISYKNAFTTKDIPHFEIGNKKDWVLYIIPTAEQMLGFLRSKGIKFHFDDETNYWRVDTSVEPISISHGVSEQKEFKAIDAALEHLKTKKNEI